MSFLCSIGNSGANAQVVQQFANLDNLVTKYDAQVLNIVGELGTFALPNLSYTVQLPSVYDYSLILPGQLPSFDSVDTKGPGDAPAPPEWETVAGVVLDPPPSPAPSIPDPHFTDTAITMYQPSFPGMPVLNEVVNPVFGDHTSAIVAPIPRPITLPPTPDIDWDAIDLDVTLPVFTALPPDPADFAFVLDDYQIQILNDVKPVIESMLQGQSGLPAAVEDAIWARQGERELMLSYRAEDEVKGSYASAGFVMPGGPMNFGIARVRQDAQDKVSTLARDVMIRAHEVVISQLNFAVAQGLAYENLFVQLYTTVQNLRLEAAKFEVQIALQVFQAYVSKFQVDAQLVQLELDTKKMQIQIELGKLEEYRSFLEGQKLIGELNQQDIELYNSRLNAVKTDAEIYATEVQAAKLILDENSQIIEQTKLLIEEEVAKLNAVEVEVKIASELTQREAIKQQTWATRAQTFATEAGVWAQQENVRIENMKAELARNAEISQRYTAQIEGYRAKVDVVRTLGQLIVSNNESKTQAYSALTSGNSAYNTALTEKTKSLISSLQQNVELAIKNGEINIQNVLEGKRLEEQALSSAMQAATQVLSSALAAHHASASISDSSGVSGSCNYNTNQTVDG